jgi:hypothetical protein
MYTSGIITIRKRKQISLTVENKLCRKTLKNVTVEVKVKVPTIHAVKAYGGVEVRLHSFLTSAVDGEWLHASAALLKMERAPRCK